MPTNMKDKQKPDWNTGKSKKAGLFEKEHSSLNSQKLLRATSEVNFVEQDNSSVTLDQSRASIQTAFFKKSSLQQSIAKEESAQKRALSVYDQKAEQKFKLFSQPILGKQETKGSKDGIKNNEKYLSNLKKKHTVTNTPSRTGQQA